MSGKVKNTIGKIVGIKGTISEWKETVQVFKEWRIKEKEKQADGYMEELQKLLTPEEIEEIETAAYSMSRKYKYHKLMKAAASDIVEGREVHGWMQRMFRHRYDWLIDNFVFDYAVNYALKYYNPEVFNVIKNYDFDNAIINVINLVEPTNFDIYPEFVFGKIIVLTQGESFENAVHWIENHPWTDNDGYSTTKTLAPCNFLNMGFSLWDLPVLVLKDTVGKDKLFFEAKTSSMEITDVKDNIFKKHIYTKRQEEETSNEKYQELEIKHGQLEKRHQYFVDNIRAGDIRNADEKLRDFAQEFDESISNSPKYKKVVIGIIIALLVIFVAISLISFFVPKQPVSTEPPLVLSLFTRIFKLCLFNRGF